MNNEDQHSPTSSEPIETPASCQSVLDAALNLSVDVPSENTLGWTGRIRAWIKNAWDDSPGWVTSVVVHGVLLILLGTATLSPLPNPVTAFLEIAFTGGDEILVLDSAPLVEIEAPAPALSTDHSRAFLDSLVGTMEPAAGETVQISDSFLPANTDRVVLEGNQSGNKTLAPNRVDGQSGDEQEIGFSLTSQPDALHYTLDPMDKQDAVVARFIEYDLGELEGEEGDSALSAFNELGKASVPSLVRGLNAAGRISASCPVLVIRRKLETVLHETDDSETWEYAMQHVGEGLTDDAAHYGAIVQLRDQLQARYYKTRIAEAIERGDVAEKELSQALNHPSATVRAAALQALREQSADPIASAMIPQLSALTEDHAVRKEAEATLVQVVGRRMLECVEERRLDKAADLLRSQESPAARWAALRVIETDCRVSEAERWRLAPTVAGLVDDEEPKVHEEADRVLRSIMDERVGRLVRYRKRQQLQMLLDHDLPRMRLAALRAIKFKSLSSEDESVVRSVIQLLSDSDPEIGKQAETVLRGLPCCGKKPLAADLAATGAGSDAAVLWTKWWDRRVVRERE
ncbi:MAG: hypothetical protein N2C14_23180, partial [Planctomycetales bacterium]